MTPDPAPTVRQLLAFYLEAGVDCALADEPVDRLADPDVVAAVAAARDAAPNRNRQDHRLRPPPARRRGEVAPAPEAAIMRPRARPRAPRRRWKRCASCWRNSTVAR